MAGRSPRPLGTAPSVIDSGTAALNRTPAPGSVGATAASGAPDGGPLDPAIEALNLRGAARNGAYVLKRTHPSVTFTSGRRSKEDQARAMASNVVKKRKWIGETYKPGVVSKACQTWVDQHPDAKTKEQIAAGLLSVMTAAKDDDLARLSRHLSGDAFDVQPVQANADAIKKTIRGLKGLDIFLDKEGGLVRWHAQFF